MSIFCFLGRHRVSLISVKRAPHGGYLAHCEQCATPLERDDKRTWRAAEPLSIRSRAA